MACHQHYGLVYLITLLAIAGTPVMPALVGPVRPRVISTCEPIGSLIPMCSGVGYPNASFPNHRNHKSMSDANAEIRDFVPLIKTGCSNALVLLLCAVYAPFCDIAFHQYQAVPIPPCVALCEYVKEGCKDTLLQRFGIRWPDHLQCERYASENFNYAGLCFGPQTVEELRSIVPPTDTGPRDMVDPPLDFNIATDGCRRNCLTFSWRLPGNIPEDFLPDYQYSCEPQPPDFPKSFTNVPASMTVIDKLDGFDLSTTYTCKLSLNSNNDTTALQVTKTVKTLDKAVLIRFVNDTPTAREDTIYAEFTTDPAVDQVSCTLLPRGSAKQKNCDSGSVTYADLQPGEYFVRLIAKIGTCATNRFRRKVEVPCRVLLKYVRRSKRYIIVKFAGVGIRGTALTSFTYSLDGQDAQPCTSPLRLPLSNLVLGNHRLEILPDNEDCLAITKAPYVVNFTV